MAYEEEVVGVSLISIINNGNIDHDLYNHDYPETDGG